jgi:hypothetical protein
MQFDTGAMSSRSSRSEEVVEDYKRHKLSRSALLHIRDLLHAFEQERVFDQKLALAGLVIIVLLISISLYWFLSSDSVILP